MDQVPGRVTSRTRVTSSQTERSEVQLHTNGDELVQRIALVGGVSDNDLRRQRIITGQSRDTERLVTKEERGDDVLADSETATSGGSLINELIGSGAGTGADKRVGLGDHAATVDGTNLALVERRTLVAVVGGIQPIGIAHQVASNARIGREDVATVDHRSAVTLQAGHGVEDSRGGHRGVGSSRVAVQRREALGGQRSRVTVNLNTTGAGHSVHGVRVIKRTTTLGGGTDRRAAGGEIGANQGVTNHGVNPEGHVQTRGLGGLLERVEQVRGAEDVGQTDHLTVLGERLAEAVQGQSAVVRGADGRTLGADGLDTRDARRTEAEHRDGLVTIVPGDRSLHGELIQDGLLLNDGEQLLAEVVLELARERS